MFKVESYITPLLLSYVEKYVKNLKAEGTQVSLWGGDAVFSGLDLRTEVLERELHLPLQFVNGHVHQLRLHVPWHKITSEPIVVTIDTMECVMRLPGQDRADTADTTAESTASSQQSPPRRLKQVDSEEAPPGYIQSIINRITNNISIVCNNLILKYVEDDIVLSINVRTVILRSADETWSPAFCDFVPPLLFLRKLITFTDFTVCLDRRNASGKIETYQEPLLYRCLLEARCQQQFSGLHAAVPDVFRLDLLCPHLEFSITDVQVPMFLRLLELSRALLFGELARERSPRSNSESSVREVGSDGEAGGDQSWASWAWSTLPSMLPVVWDAADPPDPDRLAAHERVLHFSAHVQRADTVLKMSVPGGRDRRARFRPYLRVCTAGAFVRSEVRGVHSVTTSAGVSQLRLLPCDACTCHQQPASPAAADAQADYLSLGRPADHYLSGSLFETPPSPVVDTRRLYTVHWDAHMRERTESWLLARTPAVALDYLYVLDLPDDASDDLSELGDLEHSDLAERALLRLVVGRSKLTLGTGAVHRLSHLVTAAASVAYPPYRTLPEPVPEPGGRPPPVSEVEALVANCPTRDLQITILEPEVVLLSTHDTAAPQEFGSVARLELCCQSVQLHQQMAMYPTRLSRCLSRLSRPPPALLHNCHTHTRATVTSAEALLWAGGARNRVAHMITGSLCWAWLTLPQFWPDAEIARTETTAHADRVQVSLSPRQGGHLLHIYQSLALPSTAVSSVQLSAPDCSVPVECDLRGLELRQAEAAWCWAASVSVGAVSARLAGSPLLSAPSDAAEGALRACLQLPVAGCRQSRPPLLAMVSRPVLVCWHPAMLHWLCLTAALVPPRPAPTPTPPPPPPPPPAGSSAASERGSVRSGPRSPATTSADVPMPHSWRHSRSGRSVTTGTESGPRSAPRPAPPPPAPPAPPAAPAPAATRVNWLPALERLQVRLDVGAVTLAVPVGDLPAAAEQAGPPAPAAPAQTGAPVPGRVHSSAPADQHCLDGYLVMVLPCVQLLTTALRASGLPVVPEIPAVLPQHSGSSVSRPWSVRLCGAQAYMQLCGGRRCALAAPAELECTVGLSSGGDGGDQLSVVIHANTPALALTLAKQQVLGLACLVEQGLAVMDRLSPLLLAVGNGDTSAEDVKLDSGTRGSVSGEETWRWCDESPPPPPVTLWVQWTLPRLSAEVEGVVLLEAEDLALSLDAQPVYTKAKLSVTALEVCRRDRAGRAGQDPSLVVFTGQRRLTRRLVVSSAAGAAPAPPADHSPPPPPPPAAPQKALLSVVWTRALRASVLERWGCGGGGVSAGTAWLTELTVRLKPCDLVLAQEVLLPLAELLTPLLTSLLTRPAAAPPPPPVATAARGLALNSRTLPLVYARCDSVRLLLPSGGAVCLCQLAALRLEPSADFPLQRPLVRPDLLSAAQAAGTLCTPGADTEDRHYQAELSGLTITTGAWAEVLAVSAEPQHQAAPARSTMGENPAVEWNNYNPLQSPRYASVVSILDSCDFRVTLAPAMVSGAGASPVLVAGHALEVHACSAIAAALSRRQMALLARLAADLQQLLMALPPVGCSGTSAATVRAPPSPAAAADSGLGSARTETTGAPPLKWVPFEALFTLAETTATIYDHAGTESSGAVEAPVPLLRVSISQPHAFLSCRPDRQRLQLSVFDVSVRAAPRCHDAEVCAAVPGAEAFPLSVLETRPGQPHPKTGIPPALFTATLQDFFTDNGSLSVEVARPVRCCWGPQRAHHVHQLLTMAQEVGQIQAPAATPDTPGPDVCERARQLAVAVGAASATCGQLVLELELPTAEDGGAGEKLSRGVRLRASVAALSVSVRAHFNPGERQPQALQLDACVTDAGAGCAAPTRPWRPLLGPWSATVTSELHWQPWSCQPYATAHLTSDALPAHVGPDQLICLESLFSTATSAAEVVYQPEEAVPLKRPAAACDLAWPNSRSEDDLRAGRLLYAQGVDTDCPLNHVCFDKEAGTMSWHYPEPRCLTSVHVFPVPFVAGSEFSAVSSADTAEVPCALQYYDRLRRRFVTLCGFQLSESQTSRLELPIPVETSKAPCAALWRVRINVSETGWALPAARTAVCPTALAACLRVDSEFRPAAVARLRVAADLGGLLLRLHVQTPPAAEWPPDLRGYQVTGGWPADHSFSCTSIDGASVSVSVWPDVRRLEMAGAASISCVSYAYLTDVKLLEPTPFQLEALLSEHCEPAQLELQAVLGGATVRLSPAILHTLSTAVTSWRAARQQAISAAAPKRVLHCRYVVRNNTGCPLVAGQAGTSQVATIPPRHALLHSWADRRRIPLLQLSLAGEGATWSEPLSLEEDGVTVRHLASGVSTTYPVTVTVQPLSATQKLVTVEGRLRFVNGLERDVWLQVTAAPHNQLVRVPARSAAPSVLCADATLEVAEAAEGSRPEYVPVELGTEGAQLVRLGSDHAWCSTLHSTVDNVQLTLVVLSAVFRVRSLMPAVLRLSETPGGYRLPLAGRGVVHTLHLDPALSHQLTLQLREDSESSSPPLSLSLAALDQCPPSEGPPPSLDDVIQQVTAPQPAWLGEEGSRELTAADQPDIQLQVSVSRSWPWLNTLQMEIRPSLVVVNESLVSLAVRCHKRDAEPCFLPPGAALAPPLTEDVFYLSVLADGEEYQSGRLQLSDTEWPYQRPLPSLHGVVPPDGAVRLGVYVKQMMALLCVDSRRGGGLRVLRLRPAVLAVNRTARCVPLAALAAPDADASSAPLPEVVGDALSPSETAQPLLWWRLAAGIPPDPVAPPERLSLLLDMSGCRQQPLLLSQQRDSCVLHGPSRQPAHSNCLLRVSHTFRRGQTFVSVRDEDAPFLLVCNATRLPLVVNQPGIVSSGPTFVTAAPRGEVGPGQSCYFPAPELPPNADPQLRHRLSLAVAGPRASQSQPELAGERGSVDLTYEQAQFVQLSGHHLTAQVRVRGHTHRLLLRPVSRLEVAARDVRARLARAASGDEPAPVPAAVPAAAPEHEQPTAPAAEPALLTTQLRLTLACDRVSLALADDVSSVSVCQEVVRLTADGAALQLTPGGQLSVCVADLQLDSQLTAAGQHYPVLAAAREPAPAPALYRLPTLQLSAALNRLRRAALLTADAELEPGWLLRSLRLSSRPLRLFVEDRSQPALTGFLLRLTAAVSADTAGHLSSDRQLPPEAAADLAALASRLCVQLLRVEPLHLQLSVRTQQPLSLSIDDAPMQLPAFEAVDVRASPEQLIHQLATHYMWSAIYKAGGVVASLDLLGDPAGLARSLAAGVRDLVRLPARGLLTGSPAALVSGCAAGLASLGRHAAAGAVGSVTSLAAALAHNLHRLSLDGEHVARAEAADAPPAGLAAGLARGLTALGLGLLGAVAGIADQPLQAAARGSPVALAAGLGRGLVGALTKPLGAAADLLAHTGQGLLHSVGWRRRPERRHLETRVEVSASAVDPLWYAVHLCPDSCVLCVADASQPTSSAAYRPVTLVLTTHELLVCAADGESLDVDVRLPLSELELVISASDPTELVVYRTGAESPPPPPVLPSAAEDRHTPPRPITADAYVCEYVRRAAGGESGPPAVLPGGAGPSPAPLLTVLVSAERRPLLISAYRAGRCTPDTGFAET